MNTKIVYVVTSDETDVYLEQALLSVFSLRKHNPNAYVELVVDQDTDSTIAGKRGEILKYIDNKVVVNVPEEYNIVCRSRWIKTSLRLHVKGDFLYIDTDTIVTDDLSEIDSFKGNIGAVRDSHVLSSKGNESYVNRIKKYAFEEGWKYSDEIPFYNGGVLFVRDSDETYAFFHFWHDYWKSANKKYDRYIDQSPLAATNERFQYPIIELSGEWNCQLAHNGIPYLVNAKIMHYLVYGKSKSKFQAWMFYDPNILQEIKKGGYVPNHISELVDKAKESFFQPNTILCGRDSDFYGLFQTPLFSICKANQRVFSLFNYTAKMIQKAIKIKHRVQDLL